MCPREMVDHSGTSWKKKQSYAEYTYWSAREKKGEKKDESLLTGIRRRKKKN